MAKDVEPPGQFFSELRSCFQRALRGLFDVSDVQNVSRLQFHGFGPLNKDQQSELSGLR